LLQKLMDFKNLTFTDEQIAAYNSVRDSVHQKARELFEAPGLKAEMSFFSHINSTKAAQNTHDEYWHPHIDTEQYSTFAVTSILYLNEHTTEYDGGAFRFADDDQAAKEPLGGPPGGAWSAVQPKQGRIVMFSSGRENVHHVEPVTAGVRMGLTMAFTCSQAKADSVLAWDGGPGSAALEMEE